MNREKLTEKEEKIWQYILGFESDHGYTPSLEQTKEEFDFIKSRFHARYYFEQLIEKGYLEKVAIQRKYRIIELPK